MLADGSSSTSSFLFNSLLSSHRAECAHALRVSSTLTLTPSFLIARYSHTALTHMRRRHKPLDISIAPAPGRRQPPASLSCRLHRVSAPLLDACSCPPAACSGEVACRVDHAGAGGAAAVWTVQVTGTHERTASS